ncbi:hypothetical protein K438DRAFT_328754 [Mycena galopus ATCC 62051]|nr:hypothetical protein K438DRAFT_328754 [Mycena galopus ATCC 62051]
MSAEVISTPEILEQILVQLPIRDLLVTVPLVCKTWQAVTLSPALQRALFFAPDSASKRVQNPLLREMFPPFFAFWEASKGSFSDMDDIEAMPWSKAPNAFKRQEASWRRMLIAQPPPQSVIIQQTTSGMTGLSERQAMLKDLSFRMGLLYDLTALLVSDEVTTFWVHWQDDTECRGNLTLEVNAAYGCMDALDRTLDERFHSDGARPIEIPFGGWKTTMWD